LDNLKQCDISVVRKMVAEYHGYKSMGSATLCFAYYEDDTPVACFSWLPPAPGAAKTLCPEMPAAVLSLSRMVAVPKSERTLKHISKPLRYQMRHLIDRTRWPVLVTYSDETMGHNGFVYQCSGWEKTARTAMTVHTNSEGERKSSYSNGGSKAETLMKGEKGFIQRWENWACEKDQVKDFMESNGWIRQAIPGKNYRSGNPAYRIVKISP
jgi:hypothetical protein